MRTEVSLPLQARHSQLAPERIRQAALVLLLRCLLEMAETRARQLLESGAPVARSILPLASVVSAGRRVALTVQAVRLILQEPMAMQPARELVLAVPVVR